MDTRPLRLWRAAVGFLVRCGAALFAADRRDDLDDLDRLGRASLPSPEQLRQCGRGLHLARRRVERPPL